MNAHRLVACLVVLTLGCGEERRTNSVTRKGLIFQERTNVLVAVGKDASIATRATAEYVRTQLAFVAGAELAEVSVGIPEDTGGESLIIAVGNESLGEQNARITALYDDSFRVESRRQGRRTLIQIASGTDIGLRIGANALLHVLGVRFPHPMVRTVVGELEGGIPLPIQLQSHPTLSLRALHLESVRPGPWVRMIYGSDPEDLEASAIRNKVIDWLVWHRINTVAFDLLSPLTDAQTVSVQQFIADCKSRGLSVAAVVNGGPAGPYGRHVYGAPSVVLEEVDLQLFTASAQGSAPDYGETARLGDSAAGLWTTELGRVLPRRARPVVYEVPQSFATGRDQDVPVFFAGEVVRIADTLREAEIAGAHGAMYRHRGPAYGAWLHAVAFAVTAWDSAATSTDILGQVPEPLSGLDWEALLEGDSGLGPKVRKSLLGEQPGHWLAGALDTPVVEGLGPMGRWLGADSSAERASLGKFIDELDAVVAAAEAQTPSTEEPEEEEDKWTLDSADDADSSVDSLYVSMLSSIRLTSLRAQQLNATLEALELRADVESLVAASTTLSAARTEMLESESSWLLPSDYLVPTIAETGPCLSSQGLLKPVRTAFFWNARQEALTKILQTANGFTPSPLRVFRADAPTRVRIEQMGETVEEPALAAVMPPLLLAAHTWTQGFLGTVDISLATDVDANGEPDGIKIRNEAGVNSPESQSSRLDFDTLALPCVADSGELLGELVFEGAALSLIPRYKQGLITDILAMSLTGALDIMALAELIAIASDGAHSVDTALTYLRSRLKQPEDRIQVRFDWVGIESQ